MTKDAIVATCKVCGASLGCSKRHAKHMGYQYCETCFNKLASVPADKRGADHASAVCKAGD